MGFRLTTESIHVASVLLAFLFIFLRPSIRKYRGRNPVWLKAHVVHDYVSGLTLPTFFAMICSLIQANIITQLAPHILAVAGGIGILTVLLEVVSDPEPGPPHS